MPIPYSQEIITGFACLAVYEAFGVLLAYRKSSSKATMHIVSALLLPVYLGLCVLALRQVEKNEAQCDLYWKLTCLAYISLTVSVYLYYYKKSRIVRKAPAAKVPVVSILSGIGAVGIFFMLLSGLVFFLIPIDEIRYNAMIYVPDHGDGEACCFPIDRMWIPIIWTAGDTLLSAVLLLLFVYPLCKSELNRRTERSESIAEVSISFRLRRLAIRHIFTMSFAICSTMCCMVYIATWSPPVQNIIFCCALDMVINLHSVLFTPLIWPQFLLLGYDMRAGSQRAKHAQRWSTQTLNTGSLNSKELSTFHTTGTTGRTWGKNGKWLSTRHALNSSLDLESDLDSSIFNLKTKNSPQRRTVKIAPRTVKMFHHDTERGSAPPRMESGAMPSAPQSPQTETNGPSVLSLEVLEPSNHDTSRRNSRTETSGGSTLRVLPSFAATAPSGKTSSPTIRVLAKGVPVSSGIGTKGERPNEVAPKVKDWK